MISSNAKVYNEKIENPSVIEFEYSFSELSALLTFPRPDSLLNLLLNTFSLLLQFMREAWLCTIPTKYFYSHIDSPSPLSFEETQHQLKKINHVGYLIKKLSPSAILQIRRMIEFCNQCSIPVLSISSHSNDINTCFLKVLKVCLEYTGLGDKDFRIEILHSPTLELTTATNCLRDIKPTLYLVFNGPLLDTDVVIIHDLSIGRNGDINDNVTANDEMMVDLQENAKIRYLNNLTMKKFLEAVIGAHTLNNGEVASSIIQLSNDDTLEEEEEDFDESSD